MDATTPPPHEVVGFQSARSAGLLPVIGLDRPSLVGPTAGSQAGRVLIILVAGLLALIVSVLFAARGVIDPLIAVPVVALGTAGLGLWLARSWQEVGQLNARELQNGYTTLELKFGSFTPGRIRWYTGAYDRAGWDYSSCWVLDRDGNIRKPPSTSDGDPPGFYPSPFQPGSYEQWTGCAWTGWVLSQSEVYALRR